MDSLSQVFICKRIAITSNLQRQIYDCRWTNKSSFIMPETSIQSHQLNHNKFFILFWHSQPDPLPNPKTMQNYDTWPCREVEHLLVCFCIFFPTIWFILSWTPFSSLLMHFSSITFILGQTLLFICIWWEVRAEYFENLFVNRLLEIHSLLKN